MDKHPDSVAYEGGIEKLAIDLGNLRYDALAEVLELLSAKLKVDASADADRGRGKLARELTNASVSVASASECIERAWRISEPHM